MKKLMNWPPVRAVRTIYALYHRCAGSQSAAALAYFLILTLFPLLLCISYCVGLLRLDLEQLLISVEALLPQGVQRLLEEYLHYAAQARSAGVLLAALGTLLVSASAGIRTLMRFMTGLYGMKHRRGGRYVIQSVALSVLLVLSVYLSLAVIVAGEWLFRAVLRELPGQLAAVSGLWLWLRYVLLFCCMLLVVLMVYWAGSPADRRGWPLIGAALAASGTMAASSAGFSWFLDMSARYSLVYGSLASLIILLVWLYYCGNILILGAVIGRIWSGRPCQKEGDWLQ